MGYKILKTSPSEKTYMVIETENVETLCGKHIVREEYWNSKQWQHRDRILNMPKVRCKRK